MLNGDYKTARHLETVKERETDLPGGSVAQELMVYFHASLHSDAEGSPIMGTKVTVEGRGIGARAGAVGLNGEWTFPAASWQAFPTILTDLLWMQVIPINGGER